MNRIIAALLIVPLVLAPAACSDRTAAGPDKTTIGSVPAGMVVSNVQSSYTAADVAGVRASIAN